jgi:chromosome segregation ATPase
MLGGEGRRDAVRIAGAAWGKGNLFVFKQFGAGADMVDFMVGEQLKNLQEECKKLRLVYLAAEARNLGSQHNAYWCDLEDLLRDGQQSIEKGWTVEEISCSVNTIFEALKDIKNECIRLQNQVLEKKTSRRKQKST